VPTSTNKMEKWGQAREVFGAVKDLYPANELAAAAWGEMGNCALQMAATDPAYCNVASNAYQQAVRFPTASVAVRNQAKCGLATVLEKQAQLAGGEAQVTLLKQARDQVLDVYSGKEEPAEGFWRKKSGMEAARLSEVLNEWPQALELYRDMLRQKLFPPDLLERKITNVEKQLHPAQRMD